ncbi:MAG: hypothetical protein L0Y42_11780, partial [Phycisphaerales bacterium]|nr:hypothetical protein [Phycisphaerales bacterium]
VVADDAGSSNSAESKIEGWRVRRQTIEVLRSLQGGEPVAHDARSINRANRLLAAYFRQIIGREPPTMRWAFGERIV